jgi:hypothetical protein
VRDTARSLWPEIAFLPEGRGGADVDPALAGQGPVARSPRAVALALAALAEAGLVQVDDTGFRIVQRSGTADLDAGAVGRHAAALREHARVMAGRAMTIDVLGEVPNWLPEPSGALS